MSSAIHALGIHQLSRDERIELVLEIWDSIAAESASTSLSDSQRNELRRRVADDDASPDDVVEWEQVKEKTLAGMNP